MIRVGSVEARQKMPFGSVRRALFLWLAPTALFLALPSGSALAADRWTDMSDDQWMTGYGVTAAQVATVATGYEDGTFRPDLPVSRGQFAKMAVAGLGLETRVPAAPSFTDVPAAADLFPWIEGAAAAEVVSGYDDGTFRPTTPVTRQQAGSILGLFLSSRELSVAGHIAGDYGEYPSLDAWNAAEGAAILAAFADAGNVSSAHAGAFAYLVFRGVVQGAARLGGAYLDPLRELARAQAVVLVLRANGIAVTPSRSLDPFVSTAWLEANADMEGLVIIDVRSAADYAAGHIPDSISVPFGSDSAWAKPENGLTLESPPQADLFKTVGDCGIAADSSVVLVGGVAKTAPTYPLVDTARVAATLISAGIKNVSILQGGYQRWAAEGKTTTLEVPSAKAAVYSGPSGADIFVSTEYVEEHIGTATIVDTRGADVYFGATIDAAAPKVGHIPTARSLPTTWLWRVDGAYATADLLEDMAAGVVGEGKDGEIIVYCTFGGTASCWWFVLTQVLGYRSVKLYDGSAQAWVKDNDMVAYTWGL